jgi:hypothetical protein
MHEFTRTIAMQCRTLITTFAALMFSGTVAAVCPSGTPIQVHYAAMAETLALSSGPRVIISDFYQINGFFPNSNAQAALPAPTAFQIDSDGDGIEDSPPCFMQSLTVGNAGVFVTIVNATPGFPQGSFTFTPTATGGTVAWICTTDIVDATPSCTYTGPSVGRALTWGHYGFDATLNVSGAQCYGTPLTASGGGCDPYRGDTERTDVLPILCLLPQSAPAPAGLPDPTNYYLGWSGGSLALSVPVRGTQLYSRAVANARCAQDIGPGWRMAEFHDGGGGWGLRGFGALANTSRYWVGIRDQNSNPWGAWGNDDNALPMVFTLDRTLTGTYLALGPLLTYPTANGLRGTTQALQNCRTPDKEVNISSSLTEDNSCDIVRHNPMHTKVFTIRDGVYRFKASVSGPRSFANPVIGFSPTATLKLADGRTFTSTPPASLGAAWCWDAFEVRVNGGNIINVATPQTNCGSTLWN